MTEGYSDIAHKEVRWTKTWCNRHTLESCTDTAVAIVEHGIVMVSEELFDQMMTDLGFVKEEGA